MQLSFAKSLDNSTVRGLLKNIVPLSSAGGVSFTLKMTKGTAWRKAPQWIRSLRSVNSPLCSNVVGWRIKEGVWKISIVTYFGNTTSFSCSKSIPGRTCYSERSVAWHASPLDSVRMPLCSVAGRSRRLLLAGKKNNDTYLYIPQKERKTFDTGRFYCVMAKTTKVLGWDWKAI